MKRSLISQALSGLLIIPAAILGLAGMLMLLTLFFFTGSALGLEENLDVILSVLLTTVGLFLCYKSQRSKTINLAAFHGKIKSVKKHLTSGVDVNHKDKEERTPLHEATGAGHKEIAELLIGAGAEVNSTDEDGGTPLHFAAWKGHKEIVELLIAKGAGVNAMAEDRGTPLHYAAAYNGDHWEITKLLINNGADVNAKGDGGVTPLHNAALDGYKEIAELLINKGADVNAKISSGLTPLFLATGEGHKEVVELLIAKDADVNAKDDGGGTPLDLADGETAALLRKHGGKTGEELKAEAK
jgi:cytohesin